MILSHSVCFGADKEWMTSLAGSIRNSADAAPDPLGWKICTYRIAGTSRRT
jgi:hypothetical protein